MEELIQILHQGNYSCVIRNGTTRTFTRRGVADLYSLLKDEPSFLNGAAVADKVIGKGAAAILVKGGVKRVYADVISLSALTLLREAGIETDFGSTVPFIQNRDKSGWCPMEKICYEEKTAEDILPLIEKFIDGMKPSV